MIVYRKLQPGAYPHGPRVVALSIVTTGLRQESARLVEVSAVALDRRHPFNRTDQVIGMPNLDLEETINNGDASALDIHTSNGLLEDLADNPEPVQQTALAYKTIDTGLATWLDSVGASGVDFRSPLICFGTEWTRDWMRKVLPLSLGRLSKDSFDLGAVLRLVGAERQTHGYRAGPMALYAAKVFAATISPAVILASTTVKP